MKLILNETKYLSQNLVITSDVPLDIRDGVITYGNFDLQMFDGGSLVEVAIVESEVSVSVSAIEISTLLAPNTNYILNAFSIPGSAGQDVDFVVKQIFKFLVIEDEIPADNASTNNVYTQLNNIEKILSVDHLLKNKKEYSLKFNPSNYSVEIQNYKSSDEEVSIDNDSIILDNLISQYFSEYKNFYDVINLKTKDSTLYDNEYINNLHQVFMNNIVKWNSLKGNKAYIELMVSLYAKYTGQNVISIVEDPVDNFMYRVSSSIPKQMWDTQIKQYIHPVSWKVIYNEITSNTDSTYYQIPNMKKLFRETWIMDCISYLDAQQYARHPYYHYAVLKNIYHTSGNIEPYNASTHEHGAKNCSFQNVRDESKLGITFNAFSSPINYEKQGLFKELKDRGNIRFSVDKFNNTIELDFGLTGVTNEYIYEFYNSNVLYNVIQTSLSKITVPFNDTDIIVLKLQKNGWVQYVNRIDLSAFTQYKTTKLSCAYNSLKTKYINIRSGLGIKDFQHYQYNGIMVSNFNSEAGNSSSAYATDFDYMFTNGASATAFASEFDNTSNFVTTYTPVLNYGGVDTRTELIANGNFTSWAGSADNPVSWNLSTPETSGNFVTHSGSACRFVSDGTYFGINQAVLTAGKMYKWSLNISLLTGTIAMLIGLTQTLFTNTTGIKTGYSVAGNASFEIKRISACDTTFDDVSVQEALPYFQMTVSYNKPGIANKYEWNRYLNGVLVETKTTHHNKVNFIVPATDYLNTTVGLKIYYKNGSYTLTNKSVSTL